MNEKSPDNRGFFMFRFLLGGGGLGGSTPSRSNGQTGQKRLMEVRGECFDHAKHLHQTGNGCTGFTFTR
jgi:hypothetical protein